MSQVRAPAPAAMPTGAEEVRLGYAIKTSFSCLKKFALRRNAAAMVQRGADQVVVGLGGPERRVSRQRHVGQGGQHVPGRQRLDRENIQTGVTQMTRTQRVDHRV